MEVHWRCRWTSSIRANAETPLCNVVCGSEADKLTWPKIEIAEVWFNSGQTRVRLECPLNATDWDILSMRAMFALAVKVGRAAGCIGLIRDFTFGVFLVALQIQPAFPQVHVQGSVQDIRLEANDATVEDMLTALHSRFDLQFHGTALNGPVTATYVGSLRKIVKRVLDGCDYVIKTTGNHTEVIVVNVGASLQAATPVRFVHHRSD